MTEHEQITGLLVRLGAGVAQARTMASQLQRRCDQWVKERNLPREEAMAQLLQMVIKGRNGEAPACET
ncbi:MAG: hypothetical protein KBA71_04790 [Opitutaceae bacterium]|nr:hypothetical protein [Opitutaceae bacterium]